MKDNKNSFENTFGTVVSSGHFCVLFALFFTLEYIPNVPPHSTYVIVNGSVGVG